MLETLEKTSVLTNDPFTDRNLGLCEDGEGGHTIYPEEGALGCRNPANFPGQLLSKCHPFGATGIVDMYEVSAHIRAEKDRCQVFGVRNGLIHAIGLASACSKHILKKRDDGKVP